MEEVTDKTFQIFMDKDRDLARIANSKPWLIIHLWSREI